MDVLRTRAARWITAGLGALLAAWLTTAAPSAAATESVDVGDQPVIFVQVRGRGNVVTVRSWDRGTVQVESGEDEPSVDRRIVLFGTPAFPLGVTIPQVQWLQRDANGQLVGGGMMPPEDFPYAGFRAGPHDVVRLTADQGAHLVVMVPATTGILQVRVGGGTTTIDGYHGSNLFVLQNQGRVELTNTTTTAFAQMAAGTLYAADDTFERIRVRANTARVVFERCRSRQIETSTVSGGILYDGGSFDPGLARFESESGNVAVGVGAPAQLSARSQNGRVFTRFDRRTATVDQRDDGETTAMVGGNSGPLVNAMSARGNVYLYDSTPAGRRAASAQWRPLRQMFTARRNAAPGAVVPRSAPPPPHRI